VICLALVFLAAVLYIPALQTLFRFSVLHPSDLLLSLAAGLAGVLWFELLKLWNRRRIATQNL
jgi:P-type Ca2+ transporter type 2C